MEYDERLVIRINGSDRLKLATWAEAMGMSSSDVVRELIHRWFEKKVSIAKSDKDLK